MFRRINRLLVAAPDLDAAAAAFRSTLGLAPGRRLAMPDVAAMSELLPAGDAWIQILQPVGDGPVARFIEEQGPGIYGIGVEVSSLAEARLRVEQCGRQAHPLRVGDQQLVCLKREQLPGLTIWMSEADTGPEPADLVSPLLGIRQVTGLVEDRDGTAETYLGLFGRPARDESFRSDRFGYLGRTLGYPGTPVSDSIELAQVHRTESAMGRFWRKHGQRVYMATLNTDDLRRVYTQLSTADVRHAPGEQAPDRVLYIHPSALAGCFLGVSSV